MVYQCRGPRDPAHHHGCGAEQQREGDEPGDADEDPAAGAGWTSPPIRREPPLGALLTHWTSELGLSSLVWASSSESFGPEDRAWKNDRTPLTPADRCCAFRLGPVLNPPSAATRAGR